MNTITQLLIELGLTSSKNDKLALLDRYKDNEAVKHFFWLTYEPSISFYLKDTSFIPRDEVAYEDFSDNPVKVMDSLVPLYKRTVTGQTAQKYLIGICTQLTPDSIRILQLILDRDAGCGINTSTINKVWPNLITDPPYMRCSLIKSSNIDKFDWASGVIAQEKMDGMFFSSYWHVDLGEYVISSRNGNIIPNVEATSDLYKELKKIHMQQQLGAGIEYEIHGELVCVDLDGSLIPRKKSNGILNSVCKGEYTRQGTINAVVWDCVAYDRAKKEIVCDLWYINRYNFLKSALDKDGCTAVKLCETTTVYSKQEAQQLFKQYVQAGSEGIIVKDPKSFWRDGTSKDVVKFKVEADTDLVVKSFNPGNGKHTETFGSLLCESQCGKLSVSVSGFTDAERLSLTASKDDVIGSIITITANSILYSEKGQHSLFLPRFVTVRDDKDQADTFERIEQIFSSI